MKNNKGFTIIEIITVIVILSILIIIFYPIVNNTSKLTRESISETKKKTIVSAAEKFGNANINKFQDCIGKNDTMSDDLKNKCIYDVENVVNDLLENGFLDDEKKEILNDPASNEQYNGKILFCFNIKDISVKTHYLESLNDAYDCSGSSINYLRLSSNSGTVYAGTKKDIDIISITKPKNISVTNVPGINITVSSDYKKITISAPQNATELTNVKVTVTATFDDNDTLTQNYTLNVKNVDFGFDANDVTDDFACLEVNEEKDINIVGNNLGKINPSFKNYNVEVAINGNNLHLKGKQPGESDLLLTETNSNKRITLKNNVYSIEFIDQLPKSMYVNEERVIRIDTKGLSNITVTNSTGNFTFSDVSANSFKIKATKASNIRVPITIRGNVKHREAEMYCFEKTYYIEKIDAAKFELPDGIDEHLVLYTDNPAYTFEVNTDQTGVFCESPDSSILSCTVDNKTIALKPYSTPIDNIDIKVGLKTGDSKYVEKTIHTEIKKMNAQIAYSNDRYPATVCRNVRKSVNDDTSTTNFDTISIVNTNDDNDWCLAYATKSNRNVIPIPRENVLNSASLNGKTCDSTFKNNDNTGISKISVMETNTKVTTDFDYRIYRLDLYKGNSLIEDDTYETSINPNDEQTYEILYSYTGDEKSNIDYKPNVIVSTPDVISYEITGIQDNNGSKDDITNYEKKMTLKIKALEPGTTTIVIQGIACGTKKIKVLVVGSVECPEIISREYIYDGTNKTVDIRETPQNGYLTYSVNGGEYTVIPPLIKDVGKNDIKIKLVGQNYYSSKQCNNVQLNIRNFKINFINNTEGTTIGSNILYSKLNSNKYYDDEYSYIEVQQNSRPYVEKVGYDFNGWYDGTSESSKQVIDGSGTVKPNTSYTDSNGKWTITNDINLYGKISRADFTLSYDTNGGSGTIDNQTITYGTLGNVSTTEPIRAGYAFLGWALSSNATSAVYGPGDEIFLTEDTTLYAVWKEDILGNYYIILTDGYTYYYDRNGNELDKRETNGSFTIQKTGIYSLELHGGGGGGGGTNYRWHASCDCCITRTSGGYGGGSGTLITDLNFTAGETYTVTVGTGGSGGSNRENAMGVGGGTGGSTSFGTYSIAGGSGGTAGVSDYGAGTNGTSVGNLAKYTSGGATVGGYGSGGAGVAGGSRDVFLPGKSGQPGAIIIRRLTE